MREGGRLLAEVLVELLSFVKPGVAEKDLDILAEKLIIAKGGEPGFKRIKGYNSTICVSTNDVVVHGVPTNYRFKEGDVVGIDCGVYYRGLNTDMAQTIRIPTSRRSWQNSEFPPRGEAGRIQNDGVGRFLEVGEKALWAGIKQAKSGNRVGHISKAIQDIVEVENGYSVVRALVGHGIGKYLHEEPEIPGFLDRPLSKTPLLKDGMTIAIEVIYNLGNLDVVYANDDRWTIKTKDGTLSGLFEKTIAITKKGPMILTQK